MKKVTIAGLCFKDVLDIYSTYRTMLTWSKLQQMSQLRAFRDTEEKNYLCTF
jgi:hypothetical protein